MPVFGYFGHRDGNQSGRVFGKFSVREPQDEERFVVTCHLTQIAGGVGPLLDVTLKLAENAGYGRPEKPLKRIDHMRTDRAEGTAALIAGRPPIPGDRRIATMRSLKVALGMTDLAEFVLAKHSEGVLTSRLESKLVIDEGEYVGVPGGCCHFLRF